MFTGFDQRTYTSWRCMTQRCINPKHSAYSRYGGRGIQVCERWKSYKNFLSDMGIRPANTTIDRFPNINGHYCKDNCRWSTPTQQQLTSKRSRKAILEDIDPQSGCKSVDLTNKRFGRLVALKATSKAKSGIFYWSCRCDCGGAHLARQDNLRSGLSWHCRFCPIEDVA